MIKFIKHELSMDVCYEIFGGDDMDLYCYAWNMGQNTAYQITFEPIIIPKQKIYVDKGWQTCNNYEYILKNNLTFREGQWINILK